MVGLGIEVVDIRKLAPGKEAFPDVAHGAFDAAFFAATSDGDGSRVVAVMTGEVEQGGIEADGVAAALQHGTSQIIVQNDSRHPIPGSEGADMTAQEVLHAGIQKKKRRKISREKLRTATKAISGRRARPIIKCPKCPQST
jgi:hypothetical protein